MRSKSRVALGATTLGVVLALVGGCTTSSGPKSVSDSSSASVAASGGGTPQAAGGTYYWISQDSTLPLFVNNDLKALQKAATRLGVTAKVAGPTGINLSQFIATISQVCAQHPKGVIVVGWDPSENEPVNKCIAEGVPVVTDDADLPDSKRLAFVGTDWTQIGVAQAKAMIAATGGHGEIATTSIINADNMKQARAGFEATIAGTGLKIVAQSDDGGDRAKAATATSNLLAAHPNLVGIAGFDAESGPGIVQALKEAGKTGKVHVTAMEASESSFFKDVQDGSVDAVLVQKRELFTYYALTLLVNYNTSGIGVYGLPINIASNIPESIDTGLLVVDKSNVDSLISKIGA